MDEMLKKKNKLRILEFGSGMSTKFFIDYNNINKTNNDILSITSFDNSLLWCYRKTVNDTCLELHIRLLIECNEDANSKFT